MKSMASRIREKLYARRRCKDEDQKQKRKEIVHRWYLRNKTSVVGELKRLKDTEYVYNLIKIINKI